MNAPDDLYTTRKNFVKTSSALLGQHRHVFVVYVDVCVNEWALSIVAVTRRTWSSLEKEKKSLCLLLQRENFKIGKRNRPSLQKRIN